MKDINIYMKEHKYLKHGGREPVASKKTMLEQVVSSKALRTFR